MSAILVRMELEEEIMSVCTFFGHRDCPASVRPQLRMTLTELIEHQSVDVFYVGNKGAFDRLVRSVLRELAQEYPHIRYAVVLERMPGRQNGDHPEDFSDSVLPEGIEKAPARYAIVWRNRWMLRQADFVVTYVTHPGGGAAQFAELAAKQGKTVLNLAEQETKPQPRARP